MTVHAPHRPMPMQQRKLADWTVLAYFAGDNNLEGAPRGPERDGGNRLAPRLGGDRGRLWGPSRGSVFTGVGAVLEELVRLVVQLALVEQESGRAIAMLDLEVLGTYLDLLGERRLFAVLGFFLEQQAHRLFVSPAFVERLERKRPVSKIYLDKHQRGGRLVRRWNLVVPERWLTGSEVGERV